MSISRLKQWFPWTEAPVICNGPMLKVASPKMATEVSKAGGIGFLMSVFDMSQDSTQLKDLDAALSEAHALLPPPSSSQPLQIGVSFITGHHESVGDFCSTALPILIKHRPAAVWLFGPAEDEHGAMMRAIRESGLKARVFVQVGSVAAARAAVRDGTDVLVCQGIDAGGHQVRQGSGVISLVPEVRQMLDKEFSDKDVALFAAGGIVNGKGVAAMMALDADGIVMGTRFTVSPESVFPDHRKQLVLKSVDGGISTLKSSFNDEIVKSSLWGPRYDGRAIIGPLHDKFMSGTSLEQCQKALDDSGAESVKLVGTWAGTGVGLVNKEQPCGQIVKEVRQEAKQQMRMLAQLL
ncbi:hypothetical protein CDD82_5784 [Ophiocordyceps australis]|uniref:Uncharacterized protein n=1 Tax=Ophiocordyceps australis TaxID=1399860 RepID=A0A2C5YVQ4_9HYPO|nr:hypothetical protein CDD82_5784 [Ophiocordyceps australis]